MINNNNNNYNEILFWKIIKNKFLFLKIIKNIRFENQTIQFNSIDKYYCSNTIKFNNIKSLRWLIENKQFEILKDKLISNKYLHIDKQSIELFFKNCFQSSLIKLFYEKKYKQLLIVDLIKLTIELKNEIALKVFLNKRRTSNSQSHHQTISYFQIYPSTIVNSIQNSPISTIELIFENLNSIEISKLLPPIKNQLLKVALSNFYYKEEMLNYLINENKEISNYIFSSGSGSDQILALTYYEFSQIKSIDIKLKLLDLNLIIKPSHSKLEIKFNNLDNLSEKELKLNLKILNKLYHDSPKEEEEQQVVEELSLSFNNLNITPQEVECDKVEEKKRILKLLIIKELKSKELFLNYLIQYGSVGLNLDSIITMNNDYMSNTITQYTFSKFDCNLLNYLLLPSTLQLFNEIKFSIKIFKETIIKTNNYDEFVKFIKILFENGNNENSIYFINQLKSEWKEILKLFLLDSNISKEILDSIINIQGFPINQLLETQLSSPLDIIPFSKYKWFIEQVIKLSSVSSVYYNKFNQIPPLNQNDIIDFIIENNEFYQITTLQNKSKLNFKSIDKINYFKFKFNFKFGYQLNLNNENGIYLKSFFKSLRNCEIESLKEMESIFQQQQSNNSDATDTTINHFQESQYYQYGCFSNFSNLNDYSNLLNYLNEKGFKIFFNDLIFKEYIDELFDSSLLSEDSDYQDVIKIDFNQFPKQTLQILINQILLKPNLNNIKFICNQFNFSNPVVLYEMNQIDNINSIIRLSSHSQINKLNLKSNLNFNLKISPILNYLIKILKQLQEEQEEAVSNTSIPYYFKIIFNLLYKESLSSLDFKFNEIFKLNQLYRINNLLNSKDNNNINNYHYKIVEDDDNIGNFYYLFYYLLLKDLKFAKYLLLKRSSLIEKLLNLNDINNGIDKWFPSDLNISLNEIKNSNFNHLFLKLRNSKLFQLLTIGNKSIKEDYIFLLECKEFNLFLEIIQSDTSTTSSNDNQVEFFDIKNSLIKSLDKSSILKLISLNIQDYNQLNYLEQSLTESRLDLIKFLFKNFKDLKIKEYHFQLLFKLNQIDIIKYLFNNNNTNSTNSNNLYYNNLQQRIPIFDICFYNGFIELCDLLIHTSTSTSSSTINIQSSNIIEAIGVNQISIIFYYLNNNTLNLNDHILSNNRIVDLLKSHKDYKYLSFLN